MLFVFLQRDLKKCRQKKKHLFIKIEKTKQTTGHEYF